MIKIDLVEKFIAGSKCYVFIINGEPIISIFEAEIMLKVNPYYFVSNTIIKKMYENNINVKRKIMWFEKTTNLPLLMDKIIN